MIDKALWSALKTLEEKASLSQRLIEQAQQQGNDQLVQHFWEQIQQAEDDAKCLRHMLLNPPFADVVVRVAGT